MCISLSIVIPVFNSQYTISQVVERCAYIAELNSYQYEILLIDDGSHDKSWEIIKILAHTNKKIKGYRLLKNYGQHYANLCGFRQAQNKYIITIDDDLQNPPEAIPKLVDKAECGYDIVIGEFASHKKTKLRIAGSQLIGILSRKIFGVNTQLALSNYRCIHNDVIRRIASQKHISPYIPGLVLKYSYRRCNVQVEHQDRAYGHSQYSMRKLISLTCDLLFKHSSIPLHIVSFGGFLVTVSCFLLGVTVLLVSISSGVKTPGWASTIIIMSFFNGFLILLASVIGEYLIRILRELNISEEYYLIDTTL